jgi:hypothetical protein
MYGITSHLDHLEASKLFLLFWIARGKPDLTKIFGHFWQGPMDSDRAVGTVQVKTQLTHRSGFRRKHDNF